MRTIPFEDVDTEIFDKLASQSKQVRWNWLKGNFPAAMGFISMVNEQDARKKEDGDAQLGKS